MIKSKFLLEKNLKIFDLYHFYFTSFLTEIGGHLNKISHLSRAIHLMINIFEKDFVAQESDLDRTNESMGKLDCLVFR